MADEEKNSPNAQEQSGAGQPEYYQFVTPDYKCNKALVLLVLAAVAAVLYLGFTNNSFVISDISDAKIKYLSFSEVTDALTNMEMPGRVLPNLSFLINDYFAGDGSVSYYVINVLLHIANSFLIFLLTFKILTLGWFKGRYKDTVQKIAFACALLFVVHPIAVFTVSYIAQRATLLFSLFYLLSMLAFIDYKSAVHEEEEKKSLIVCIIFGVLALLCKETALSILPVYFVFDILFFDDKRVSIGKKAGLYIGGAALIALVYIAVISILYGTTITGYLNSAYTGTGPTFYERILTQSRVVFFYITLVLFPAPDRLSIEYDIAKSASLIDPVTTIASIAAVAALIAVTHIKKKKNPLLSFFILWYLINLAADVVLPHETAYLHNAYLPSYALFFGAGYLVVHLYGWAGDKFKEQKVYGHLVAVLFCVILSGLTFVTVTQNMSFKSRVLLWEDAFVTSPGKEAVLYNLATAYLDNEQYEKAKILYQLAFNKNADNIMTNYNLANAFFHLKRYSLAQAHYNKAIELDGKFIDAYDKLVELYLRVRRYDYAITELEKIIEIKPDHVKAYIDMAEIYLIRGKLQESLEYNLKAIELAPEDAYLHYNAARLYERLDDYKSALKEYETVLDIDINFEFKDEIGPKIKEMIKKY
jgi:tetratricopeptide (TPR) repeat protein